MRPLLFSCAATAEAKKAPLGAPGVFKVRFIHQLGKIKNSTERTFVEVPAFKELESMVEQVRVR